MKLYRSTFKLHNIKKLKHGFVTYTSSCIVYTKWLNLIWILWSVTVKVKNIIIWKLNFPIWVLNANFSSIFSPLYNQSFLNILYSVSYNVFITHSHFTCPGSLRFLYNSIPPKSFTLPYAFCFKYLIIH